MTYTVISKSNEYIIWSLNKRSTSIVVHVIANNFSICIYLYVSFFCFCALLYSRTFVTYHYHNRWGTNARGIWEMVRRRLFGGLIAIMAPRIGSWPQNRKASPIRDRNKTEKWNKNERNKEWKKKKWMNKKWDIIIKIIRKKSNSIIDNWLSWCL